MKAATALVCSLLMAATAWGQENQEATEPPNWLDVIPYAWAVGMKGTVGVKGLSTEVGSKFSDVFEEVDPGVLLTARVRLGNFVIGSAAHWVKLTTDGETAGFSKVESEDIMAELTLGYQLPMGGRSQAELFAGARGRMIDTDLVFAGVHVKDDDLWIVELDVPNGERFIV